MRRINTKIFMIHIAFACTSVFLTVFIAYQTVNGLLLENASSLGTVCAEIEAAEIDSWLKEKTDLLKSIAIQIENADQEGDGYISKILANAAKTDPSFYSFFIGFEDGSLIDANGWIPPAEYKVLERPWYREAMAANGMVFTSAYIDIKKNAKVKAIAIQIHIQGKNAVLAANIPFDTIRKQIEGIRFGETGYGVLMDEAGIVLVHHDANNEMKPMEDLQKYLNVQTKGNTWKNNKGTTVVRSGGKKELLVQVPIKANGWKLLLVAPIEEFQGPARRMSHQLLITISFLLAMMLVASYLLGRKISKQTDTEIKPYAPIAERGIYGISCSSSDIPGIECFDEAPFRKDKHIAGTEEVYDIAGQIDKTAAQLEQGIKAFKIRQ